MNTLCSKSNVLLSWSHYRTLLQVLDKEAREWFKNEDIDEKDTYHVKEWIDLNKLVIKYLNR